MNGWMSDREREREKEREKNRTLVSGGKEPEQFSLHYSLLYFSGIYPMGALFSLFLMKWEYYQLRR